MGDLYRRNAAALERACREQDRACERCGLAFRWDAEPRSRWRFSADHIVPRSEGGSDAMYNLRPMHYGCNASRGNGTTRGLGTGRNRPQLNAADLTPPTPYPSNPTSETWP